MTKNVAIPAVLAAVMYLTERRKTKRARKALIGAGLGVALTQFGPKYGINLG